jgi:hypothetical protein
MGRYHHISLDFSRAKNEKEQENICLLLLPELYRRSSRFICSLVSNEPFPTE